MEVTPDELLRTVRDELEALINTRSNVTESHIGSSPGLATLAGVEGHYEVDAWFREQMIVGADTNDAVAAVSELILGGGTSKLDRLSKAALRFHRDQRTIRRWIESKTDNALDVTAEFLYDRSLLTAHNSLELVTFAWLMDGDNAVLSLRWIRSRKISHDPQLHVRLTINNQATTVLRGGLEWSKPTEESPFIEATCTLRFPPLIDMGLPLITFHFTTRNNPSIEVLNIPEFGDYQYLPMVIRQAVVFKPVHLRDMPAMVGRTVADDVIDVALPPRLVTPPRDEA